MLDGCAARHSSKVPYTVSSGPEQEQPQYGGATSVQPLVDSQCQPPLQQEATVHWRVVTGDGD